MVRGNVPQMLMIGHTDNRIFGRAFNPYDQTRTCGGSSGGEGGLVSSKCVPFAIGTDIGGSIRSPSACCGVIGFKPTAARCTYEGILAVAPSYSLNQTAIHPTCGPLCRTVLDVKTFF